MTREWVLKRDGASPRLLACVFISLAAISLIIACGFLLAGAWMVLPFGIVELSAVGIALWIVSVRNHDTDRIVLSQHGVTVEAHRRGRVTVTEFDRAWVRVDVLSGPTQAVLLSQRGRRVAVGERLEGFERSRFVGELKRALAQRARIGLNQ